MIQVLQEANVERLDMQAIYQGKYLWGRMKWDPAEARRAGQTIVQVYPLWRSKKGRTVEWKILKLQYSQRKFHKVNGKSSCQRQLWEKSCDSQEGFCSSISAVFQWFPGEAWGRHGLSMNVVVCSRRQRLRQLVHLMFPAARDLRGTYSWSPHESIEELRDNSTELTNIVSGSSQAVCF